MPKGWKVWVFKKFLKGILSFFQGPIPKKRVSYLINPLELNFGKPFLERKTTFWKRGLLLPS